ncbi:SDR family oxidoreductase [Magnetofaba australis]|uniref:Putative short-chain dehydrogenase/reductase n=1 Tax=Magnetofaba australis IT-1 TaxID=1434232 RepID=A0A1Y2JZ03_9PROT|nr:SDR family oxidoreductase [Magnetofaba australis]OSM00099.1 putative short-chain dehydrogenase/reductase [Magnetofaba australis IT-1]
MRDFSNHPVLITGCSSGIGYHVAHGLHKRGYRVFATARQVEDVARLQAEGLEALQLDLDHSASIDTAVTEILSRTGGRLYGLFNNGAYAQPGCVEDLSREALRLQFETNLFGQHEVTTRVIPAMRAAGQGRIIQNSSVLGFVGLRYRGAYVASKFALEGLSDTLRLELAGTGIHVSLIEPGPIESEIGPKALPHFHRHIDIEGSVWRDIYKSELERLGNEPPNRWRLGPEAVLQRVIHALESPRPKIRYPVTTPTYGFAILKRLLPVRWLDRLQQYAS